MKLFDWYSICSAHNRRYRDCPRCERGQWRFEPWMKYKYWKFKKHNHVVNGMWVKK